MNNKGEILASILRNYNGCHFFLHNTKDFSIVRKIMNEGFVFESQLSHSTDCVNPKVPVEITYFLYQRKEYGKFTIIIAVPDKTFESYVDESCECESGLERVLSVTEPFYGENDELVYTIPPEHVLGFFDIEASGFTLNRKWDPLFRKKREAKPPLEE